MCKPELIDGLENIKLCLDCKFVHGLLCHRDQMFTSNAVTGYKTFVSKEHGCFTEREHDPNIVIRLYRKIIGHIPCGPEGKFWVEKVEPRACRDLLV